MTTYAYIIDKSQSITKGDKTYYKSYVEVDGAKLEGPWMDKESSFVTDNRPFKSKSNKFDNVFIHDSTLRNVTINFEGPSEAAYLLSIDTSIITDSALVIGAPSETHIIGSKIYKCHVYNSTITSSRLEESHIVSCLLHHMTSTLSTLAKVTVTNPRRCNVSFIYCTAENVEIRPKTNICIDNNLGSSKGSITVIQVNPIFITGLLWNISITDYSMMIGCQVHNHAAWNLMPDERIAEMSDGALEFWKEYKPMLLKLCKDQQLKSFSY